MQGRGGAMTLHVKTRVLPGNRIEVTAANLREGEDVEVTIRSLSGNAASPPRGILDYLDSLPSHHKTQQQWDEYERQFQQERNSWDR